MKGKGLNTKLLALVSIILIVAVILLGCGPQPPTTTVPATPGVPSPTATAPTQAIKWRANSIVSPTRVPNTDQYWGRLVKLVFERTGGRMELQAHWNNELGFGHREYPKILKEGFAEMSDLPWLMGAGYIPEMSWQAYTLYMGPKAPGHIPKWELDIRDAERSFYDSFAKDWDFTVLAAINTNYGEDTPSEIGTTKPVRTLEELRGITMRAASPEGAKLWANFGVKGVVIAMPEQYMTLKSGLVDAAGGRMNFVEYQLHEVVKYLTIYADKQVPSSNWGWAASNLHWKKLPPDIKKVMVDTFKELEGWLDQLVLTEWISPRLSDANRLLEQSKITVITFSKEDQAKIQATFDRDLAKWLAQAANDRGRAMYKAVMDAARTSERYNKLIEMGKSL